MKSKMNRPRWAARKPGAAIGLLFTPRTQTYEERMWQRAYDAAIADGAEIEDAQRVADDAAIAAKESAHDAGA